MKNEILNKATMSSLEIAELTGKLHKNVLRDVENVLNEVGIETLKFEASYLSSQNKQLRCYNLPLHIAATILAKSSTKSAAQFFDSAFKSSDQLRSIVEAVNLFDAPDLPDRYVYAAQDSQGRLKIGISKDPEERVKQLNIGHPDTLELVYIAKAIDNTYLSEQIAHEKCKDYQLRSEWFSAPALELLNQH